MKPKQLLLVWICWTYPATFSFLGH